MKYKFKPSHLVPASLFVVAVLYGGSKPPMPTNTPPDGASSPTNAPMMMCFSPRPMMSPPPEPTNQVTDQPTNQIANWTARGAWSDWQRVEFGDGFAFPVGTNLVDGVTLFARGEIREKVEVEGRGLQWNCLASLPDSVSLEPGVSEVRHGLTPSNSYLFAWHDCCVDRERTNRVDATIELFRSGAIATTVTPLSTPEPPTCTYQPPVPPDGFSGVGQDEDWIRAAFPDDADGILVQGYDSWLLNTWTGINVENGHYLVRVTIAPSAFSPASTANDQPPIYLVCGPYRVIVTAPGTYSFPLDVLTTYKVRTYPTALPLAFEYDDGYRGDYGPSFEISSGPAPRPRLMLAAPAGGDNDYSIHMTPMIVVSPNRIPLATAVGKVLEFWCNVADNAGYYFDGANEYVRLSISGSRAEIEEAYLRGIYEVQKECALRHMSGYFELLEASGTNSAGVVTNRYDAAIFTGTTWHSEMLGNRRVSHHLTAATQGGSTSASTESVIHTMAEGQSAYVAVYMASTEPDSVLVYNDSVSWQVTSNGGGSMSGSASVEGNWSDLLGAASWENELYGVKYDPLFLCGQRFDPPPGEPLELDLTATAQNATDGLRETCVQIVIYPIDADGNVIGLPDWVGQN